MRKLLVLFAALAILSSACSSNKDEQPADTTATVTSSGGSQASPEAAAASPTPEPAWMSLDAWTTAPEQALLDMSDDLLEDRYHQDTLEGFEPQAGQADPDTAITTYISTVDVNGRTFNFAYGELEGEIYGGYVFVDVPNQQDGDIDTVLQLLGSYFKEPNLDQSQWTRATGPTQATLWETVIDRPDGSIQTWSAYTIPNADGTITIGVGSCMLFANSPQIARHSCFINQ